MCQFSVYIFISLSFFFFQAEDGIRDYKVTGVRRVLFRSTHARAGRAADAIAEIRAFHRQLCALRILDPACGSGNFLYVTFELLKRLEMEILDELTQLGDRELALEIEQFTVHPRQFFGLELNPRAAAIAELVLWIGYLQWQARAAGSAAIGEPVLEKLDNIQCRDAVLAYDREPQPARDEG